MRRLSLGSASCYCAAVALLGLAWMAVCRFVVTHTPPGGTGEMTGIDHLGWSMTIMLLLFAVPALGLLGFGLGATGIVRRREDLALAERGTYLNGAAIALSVYAWIWVMR